METHLGRLPIPRLGRQGDRGEYFQSISPLVVEYAQYQTPDNENATLRQCAMMSKLLFIAPSHRR